MKLQRLYVDIDKVFFDSRSFIDGRTLHVSKKDMEKIAGDPAFSRVEFHIAEPGTKCRILNMCDTVQPALKLGDEEATFPGVVGIMKTAGSGACLMLRNVVITETMEERRGGCMLDMTEFGAEQTDLAKFHHLVVDAFPADGVPKEDYQTALHKSSKRLGKFLASLAIDLTPDAAEEFTLEREGLDGLPRIVYLADVFCHAPFQEMTLYGESMIAAMPVILHPNEVLDGAVTNKNYDTAALGEPTYIWQNHPVILELYRRHGVDLNFAGVVLSNVHHTVEWKQRNATMAAAMIHHQLRADGCVITKEGGGHPQVDVGLAIEVMEGEYGIKTVPLIAEFLSPNNDAYGQLLFKTKYADAVVSTGCAEMLDLPAVDRAIGPNNPFYGSKDGTPTGPMLVGCRSLRCCESQMGWTRFGSLKF